MWWLLRAQAACRLCPVLFALILQQTLVTPASSFGAAWPGAGAAGSKLMRRSESSTPSMLMAVQEAQTPVCSIVDNTGKSDVYPCLCGATTCSQGEWCFADATAPTCTAPCDRTDGKTVSNFYPCTCDTEMCTSTCDNYATCAQMCDLSGQTSGKSCKAQTAAPTLAPTPKPLPPTMEPTPIVTDAPSMAYTGPPTVEPTEAPTVLTAAPTAVPATPRPTESPTQAPTQVPTTLTSTISTTTSSRTGTNTSVTTTVYSTTTYTTTTRLRPASRTSECWVQDNVKTECIPIDTPPGAPAALSGLRVKDVQAFCDSIPTLCGGFIFAASPGARRFPELPQLPIVIYCKPREAGGNESFFAGPGNVGPPRSGFYKAPCACSAEEKFESGCGVWGLMSNTETVYVNGGEGGCYNHCRSRAWCTNFIVKETFGANMTQCSIAGPEQCTFDGHADFKLHVLDQKCIKDYGPDGQGWFKAVSFQAGQTSSCAETASLGCEDLPVKIGYKGAKTEEEADKLGAKACRDSCKKGTSCNTATFCRYGATCMGQAERGRCCRKTCSQGNASLAAGDLLLTGEQGGWDVFYRNEEQSLGRGERAAILNLPVPSLGQMTPAALTGLVQLDVARPWALAAHPKAAATSLAAIAAAAGLPPERLSVSVRCISGCGAAVGNTSSLQPVAAAASSAFEAASSELQTASARREKAHHRRSLMEENGEIRGVVEVSYAIKPASGENVELLQHKIRQLPPSVMDQRIRQAYRNASGMCGTKSDVARTAAADAAKVSLAMNKNKGYTPKELELLVIKAASDAAYEVGGSPTDVAIAAGHASAFFGRESGFTLSQMAANTIAAVKESGGSRSDIVSAVGDIVAEAGIAKGEDPNLVGAAAAKAAMGAGALSSEAAQVAADDADKAAVALGMPPEQAAAISEKAAEAVQPQSKQQAARIAGQHAAYAGITEGLDVYKVASASASAARKAGGAVEDVAAIAGSAAVKAAMTQCWPARGVLLAAKNAALAAGGSHADVARVAGSAAAETAFAVGATADEVARQAAAAVREEGGSPAQIAKAAAEAAELVAQTNRKTPLEVGYEAGAASNEAGGSSYEVVKAAATAAAKAMSDPSYRADAMLFAEKSALVTVNLTVSGLNFTKIVSDLLMYTRVKNAVLEAVSNEADVVLEDVTVDIYNCTLEFGDTDTCFTSYITGRSAASLRTQLEDRSRWLKLAVRNALESTDGIEGVRLNGAIEMIHKVGIEPGERMVSVVQLDFSIVYLDASALSVDQEYGVGLALAYSLGNAGEVPPANIKVKLTEGKKIMNKPPKTHVTARILLPVTRTSKEVIEEVTKQEAFTQATKDIHNLPRIERAIISPLKVTNPKVQTFRESWVADAFTFDRFKVLMKALQAKKAANATAAVENGTRPENLTMLLPEEAPAGFDYATAPDDDVMMRGLFWLFAMFLVGVPCGVLVSAAWALRALWSASGEKDESAG
eukprot:TRINITY_DN80558_c0_g1_i1.p1 TRINITY_DN80558_c0_g1~~TRINITY_DN80558_c0_g1_i1.p1  ORF type:complete len:1472 (-),score=381.84 TRINITY_DN80558_c0_g1_i1:17-4432(-)